MFGVKKFGGWRRGEAYFWCRSLPLPDEEDGGQVRDLLVQEEIRQLPGQQVGGEPWGWHRVPLQAEEVPRAGAGQAPRGQALLRLQGQDTQEEVPLNLCPSKQDQTKVFWFVLVLFLGKCALDSNVVDFL